MRFVEILETWCSPLDLFSLCYIAAGFDSIKASSVYAEEIIDLDIAKKSSQPMLLCARNSVLRWQQPLTLPVSGTGVPYQPKAVINEGTQNDARAKSFIVDAQIYLEANY